MLQFYFDDLENAIQDYDIALKINKNLDYVRGKRLYAKMSLCDWNNYEKEIKLINDDIKMKKRTISPFVHASLIDDPKQQKNITELYLKENYLASSKKNVNLKMTK